MWRWFPALQPTFEDSAYALKIHGTAQKCALIILRVKVLKFEWNTAASGMEYGQMSAFTSDHKRHQASSSVRSLACFSMHQNDIVW